MRSMPFDDVAPLLGPAELQRAAEAPMQFEEVDRLHQDVVEFEKRQRLLALNP